MIKQVKKMFRRWEGQYYYILNSKLTSISEAAGLQAGSSVTRQAHHPGDREEWLDQRENKVQFLDLF